MINLIKNNIFSLFNPHSKRVKEWHKASGDITLRLNYSLNTNSVVLDLGGYMGQWSSDIFSKYLCNIYIMEPYEPFYNNIKFRFAQNSKINVFNFGLGAFDCEEILYVNDDASSIFKSKGEKSLIKIKSFKKFVSEEKIDKIDLLKVNIEGSEYDLLEHILKNELQHKIVNLQVQFHDISKDSKNRVSQIRKELSKTHYATYKLDFVWENWKLKSS